MTNMNTSYVLDENEEWGQRYYFTYYSEFGDNSTKNIEIVILTVSFVIAIIANIGIALCVLRYKEMRTPTNLCLVNLSAADLLFALGVPAIAYTRHTQSWELGETVCRLLPYSQFVCGFVLLWTLTLISMDRHRCLAVAPYRSALTSLRVIAASIVTWIIAVSLFLPAIFWFKTINISGGRTICTLVFPKSEILNVSMCFTIPVILIACLLPMILLVYHYQRIFQRILDTRNRWAVPCVAQGGESTEANSRRRDSELSVVGSLVPWAGRKLSTASANFSQHEEVRISKHLRVVRLLLLNVVAVLTMWLPITVVMFLIYLDGTRSIDFNSFFLHSHHFVWALIIAQLNTVVNPLLYGLFSENFRACFARMWSKRDPDSDKGLSSRKSGARSLEALQDRLALTRNSGSFRNKSRTVGKSNVEREIGSIQEFPGSEKL